VEINRIFTRTIRSLDRQALNNKLVVFLFVIVVVGFLVMVST